MTRQLPDYLKANSEDGVSAYLCDSAFRPNGAGFKAVGKEEMEREGIAVDSNKFKVYLVEMANTIIDRHRDQFSPQVLQKFADRANTGSVKLLFNHDYNRPIGRIVKAWLQIKDTVTRLFGYIAVHKSVKLPDQDLTVSEAMDDGIVEDVSVGFGGVKYVAMEMDETQMPHAWRVEDDTTSPTGAELRELSVLVQGAQIGAGVVKSIKGNQEKEKTNKNMNPYTHTITVGEKSVTVTARADGESIKVEGLEDLIKTATDASAEAAKLKTELDALKADTEKAREPFVADILNFQKAAGVPDAAQYNDEKLKGMTFGEISKLSREIVAKADEKSGGTSIGSTTKAYNLKFD